MNSAEASKEIEAEDKAKKEVEDKKEAEREAAKPPTPNEGPKTDKENAKELAKGSCG